MTHFPAMNLPAFPDCLYKCCFSASRPDRTHVSPLYKSIGFSTPCGYFQS